MKANVTRALVALVAGLAVVADAFLLFVKPHLSQQSSASNTNGQSWAGNSSDSSSSNSNGNSSAESSSTATLKDGTYTSVASPNAYGEIQLQVTVAGGKITTITTLQAPSHGRSQSVNAQALPELTNRAIAAQSADIQFVSGATETSTAFVNSLQDAINQSINASN
ncbi:FMN-binding domain-containing protein [Bifidobacterium hapali]|uniref:FMN-binding domain-containing protein n=1 Tax=Bifidobacterium hapali TaxID=1630172 RepID=A0A261FX63_9BIFI|nr:FMN-binding protein [Bifidobacterium hapali]OZG63752.1 FMN-binding domain-containing protein [Bifidobacterium hapali]